MKPKIELLTAAVLCALLFLATPLHAKLSVLDSPHNLSQSGGRGRASGGAGVQIAAEQRVCVFCHVPHNATSEGPLWSRALAADTVDYIPYRSSTLNASPKPDRPTGSSRLCLSCHDGTIALSSYVGSPVNLGTKMPTETGLNNPNLTTDLSDDHPISFGYTEALALKSHLASPAGLPPSVRLEGNVNLECTSCHDPHDNQYGNFLVMNNGDPNRPDFLAGAPLCTACHRPANWEISSHNNPQVAPLATGCLVCHAAHNARWAVRLLRGEQQSDTCLANCHNGIDTTSKDIKTLVQPAQHRHPVLDAVNDPVHDENEDLPATKYHVQCVDCHNPHQVNGTDAPMSSPPRIDGRLSGVKKDGAGNLATNEYDVCFRCHAGGNAYRFAGVNETLPDRMIQEPNQEYRFDFQNPSFHPVTADRRSSGASLIATFKATMVRVYCSDCHNSDQGTKAGGTGPNGPHGSRWEHILISQYDMRPVGETPLPYNSSLYALCYRCHFESYIMDAGSAFTNGGVNEHSRHVRDRQIPCFVCHDPHGVSWRMQGNALNNAHLINFDRKYAAGATVASPVYVSEGVAQGNCTVNCHAVAGNKHSYSPTGAVTPKLFRSR